MPYSKHFLSCLCAFFFWGGVPQLIGPYAAGVLPKSNAPTEIKYIVGQNQPMQQLGCNIKSSETLLTTARECGTKDMIRSLSVNGKWLIRI